MSPCHGGQIDSLFLKELGSLHSRFLVCTAAYHMCRHLLPSALPHVTGLIIYWYCCDYWSLWSLTKEFNVFCQHPGNCGKLICWLANRVKVETVADLIFLGSKITADGDCSHEIERHLLLRKTTTNLDSVLKSREITLLTKIRIVKVMVFPVWWLSTEELMLSNCGDWRRLLKVRCTTWRSNLSILKEINLEYSSEGLLLKLNFQTLASWCEDPTHWKRPWCWER